MHEPLSTADAADLALKRMRKGDSIDYRAMLARERYCRAWRARYDMCLPAAVVTVELEHGFTLRALYEMNQHRPLTGENARV